MCYTTTISDAMADDSFVSGSSADADIIVRQWVSQQLTPGQNIFSAQDIKAQVRCREDDAATVLYLALGVRIINGTTVQATLIDVTRDDVLWVTSALTNRQFVFGIGEAWTTVSGDRIVIEMGVGGDPAFAHTGTFRLGDAAASDLPEDDTDTTDLRPWVQLPDTLTFVSDNKVMPPLKRRTRFFTRRQV